ncbi:hypothetical protein BH09VER1_BH09VER1_31320 [soil metagenome]
MSRSPRYSLNRRRGFAIGLLAGLLIVSPVAVVLLLLWWPAPNDEVIDVSIVAIVLYEIALWGRLVRHAHLSKKEGGRAVAVERKMENSSMELAESESSAA